MRPEDIIADFLERLDLTKTSADDAARDLIALLESNHLYLDGAGDCDGCC
jgi:hypothetical protein